MSSDRIAPKLIEMRRKAREGALRALYQTSVGHTTAEQSIEDALQESSLPDTAQTLLRTLVLGVVEHREELDGLLQPLLAPGWELHRISFIDHCLLRIAAFELYHVDEIPPKVSINEAVMLAKKYGTVESGKFVNGVLGSLLPQSPKASWDPHPGDESEDAAALEQELEPEETVHADSTEFDQLVKEVGWAVRSGQADTDGEPK